MGEKINNKKVISIGAILVVAILISISFLYNNYVAYNSYMEEFKEYNYVNDDFYYNNKLVKNDTLDYMQHELDYVATETNYNISALNSIINIEGIEISSSSYSTPYEELVYKDELVRSYVDDITTEYDMTTYLENNNLSNDDTLDYYNNSISFMNKRINDNLNNISFEATDLTEEEKDDKKELKSELNDIKELELSSLTLKELENTLVNVKELKSKVNTFEKEVVERQKEEKEAENEVVVTENATNYTYDDFNSSTSTNTSNWSSNSSSNSTSSNTTSYMCSYTSEAQAIADGKASGISWDVTNCGDGSYNLTTYVGDHTGSGGNNGLYLE